MYNQHSQVQAAPLTGWCQYRYDVVFAQVSILTARNMNLATTVQVRVTRSVQVGGNYYYIVPYRVNKGWPTTDPRLLSFTHTAYFFNLYSVAPPPLLSPPHRATFGLRLFFFYCTGVHVPLADACYSMLQVCMVARLSLYLTLSLLHSLFTYTQ